MNKKEKIEFFILIPTLVQLEGTSCCNHKVASKSAYLSKKLKKRDSQ